MFSKSKPNEPSAPQSVPQPSVPSSSGSDWSSSAPPVPTPPTVAPAAPRAKPTPSVLSSDLTITGNVKTSGDVQVEGIVEGDIRASQLVVGETATIKGEVVAEEVVVNGRVIGRLRGLKVRLSSSARVEGDIIHKTIAIESGAHFEGSVQRQDDPVGQGQPARITGPKDPIPVKQPATTAAE
jgi:cytoskeletal protein CcmA (bactofilin family)